MNRPRWILVAAVLVALSVAGAGAAAITGAPDVPRHGVLEAGGEAGVRGSESIEQVTRDPLTSASKGTGRDWALTVFRAKNGSTCAAPSRKVGSKAGSLNADGSVTPYPIEDGATCVDLRAQPAGVQMTKGPEGTTIHGLAGPTIKSISVVVNGTSRAVSVGPRGAFLAVLGDVEFTAVKVTAVTQSGETLTLLDPPAPPVPTP